MPKADVDLVVVVDMGDDLAPSPTEMKLLADLLPELLKDMLHLQPEDDE